MKEVKSRADGTFDIDVPQGNARIWLLTPPPGFCLADTGQMVDDLAFGPEAPVQRKDYLLRPGTVWVFQFATSPKPRAIPGVVWSGYFRAVEDAQGLAHLTLPSAGGRKSRSTDPSRKSSLSRFKESSTARTDLTAPSTSPASAEALTRMTAAGPERRGGRRTSGCRPAWAATITTGAFQRLPPDRCGRRGRAHILT